MDHEAKANLGHFHCLTDKVARVAQVDCEPTIGSLSGKLYIKKGKNGECRTEAIVTAIGGYFADSKRSGLAKEQ
ncbi:hypothetical protein Goshw_001620 [Gossypium schwendimanii]|uniref:Uncharacterized protein n=1 Tax=Gossypium schwendimanii TaxID=34291 RepID=A0A7J9L788_GOSSC|nr:hypothetical protein [Gossypium schwendimanii]